MPRIIETTVYTIDELSDAAKENAPRLVSPAWAARRVVRLRARGFRDHLPDHRRDPRYQSRAPLWRRNPRQAADLLERFQLARGWRVFLRHLLPRPRPPPRESAPTRPKTRSCIGSRTSCRRSRGATSIRFAPRSGTRGRYCHEYSMAIEVERDSPTWQPMTDGAEENRDRGATRSRALALPAAPLGIRAPDLRRSRRRDRLDQPVDLQGGWHTVWLDNRLLKNSAESPSRERKELQTGPIRHEITETIVPNRFSAAC